MLATTDRSQKLPTSPIPKGRQPVSAKSVAYDEHLGSKIRTLSEENTRGMWGSSSFSDLRFVFYGYGYRSKYFKIRATKQ